MGKGKDKKSKKRARSSSASSSSSSSSSAAPAPARARAAKTDSESKTSSKPNKKSKTNEPEAAPAAAASSTSAAAAPEAPKELTAEERELRRKKNQRLKEKRRLKKQQQQQSGEGPTPPAPSHIKHDASLEYLQQWHSSRATWRFKKSREVWLLRHMYDRTQLPAEFFALLLLYLPSIKGGARTRVLADAKTRIAAYETLDRARETSDKNEQQKLIDSVQGLAVSKADYKRALAVATALDE